MLEHISDWKLALAELCRISKEYLILHRTLLTVDGQGPTRMEEQIAFGAEVWRIYFSMKDLCDELSGHGFSICDKALIGLTDMQDDGTYKGEHWTFLCEV